MYNKPFASLACSIILGLVIAWSPTANAGTCESYGCHPDHPKEIWCKDSNEILHHMDKKCEKSGEFCYDSKQKNNPFDKIWCCKPHTGITCKDGNVWWKNSCDKAEEQKEKCYYGCSTGVGCDPPPTYNCAKECPGCCDGNVCAKGTNDSYCGKNGDKCKKCGSGYECSSSKSCVKECKKHDHKSCTGLKIVWKDCNGNVNDDYLVCQYGCNNASGCNPAPTYVCSEKCPGCCDGNYCRNGDTTNYCGKSGESCKSCGAEKCTNNVCEIPVPPYNCANDCPGCCVGNSCKDGYQQYECGTNGNSCKSCGAGYTCFNKECIEKAKPYDCSKECPGCCDGNYCRNGNTTNYCGKSGESCKSCGAEKCTNNVCEIPVPPYNCANDCPGCCVGNSCKSGNSNSVCGLNGNICQDCGVGYTCINKLCIEYPKPYDCSKECQGCCADNMCQLKMEDNSCGKDGNICSVCQKGYFCYQQKCNENALKALLCENKSCEVDGNVYCNDNSKSEILTVCNGSIDDETVYYCNGDMIVKLTKSYTSKCDPKTLICKFTDTTKEEFVEGCFSKCVQENPTEMPFCFDWNTCKNKCVLDKTKCISKSKYKKCFDDAKGCTYWSDFDFTCGKNEDCVADKCILQNSGDCKIKNASWDKSKVKDSDIVHMNINTLGNCENAEAVFQVLETDGLPFLNDKVVSMKVVLYADNSFQIPWVAEWIPDQEGNPEFYFNVFVGSQKEKSFNKLEVTPTYEVEMGPLTDLYKNLDFEGGTCTDFAGLPPACVDLAIAGGQYPDKGVKIPDWVTSEETILVTFLAGTAGCGGAVILCAVTEGLGCGLFLFSSVAFTCSALLGIEIPTVTQLGWVSKALSIHKLTGFLGKIQSSAKVQVVSKTVKSTFATLVVKGAGAVKSVYYSLIRRKGKNGTVSLSYTKFTDPIWEIDSVNGPMILKKNADLKRIFSDIGELTPEAKAFIAELEGKNHLFGGYRLKEALGLGKISKEVKISFSKKSGQKGLLGMNFLEIEKSPLGKDFFRIKGSKGIDVYLDEILSDYLAGKISKLEAQRRSLVVLIHELLHSEQYELARILNLDFTTVPYNFGGHPMFEFANDYRALKHPGTIIDLDALKFSDYSGFLRMVNRIRYEGADGKLGFTHWNKRYLTKKDPSKWGLMDFWRTAEMVGDKELSGKIVQAFKVVNGKAALKKFEQEAIQFEDFAELWSLGPKSSYFNEKTFLEYHVKFGTNVFPSSAPSGSGKLAVPSMSSKDFKVVQGFGKLTQQVCYEGNVWIERGGSLFKLFITCTSGCLAAVCVKKEDIIDEDSMSHLDEPDVLQLNLLADNVIVRGDDASFHQVVLVNMEGEPFVSDGCSAQRFGSSNNVFFSFFCLLLVVIFRNHHTKQV